MTSEEQIQQFIGEKQSQKSWKERAHDETKGLFLEQTKKFQAAAIITVPEDEEVQKMCVELNKFIKKYGTVLNYYQKKEDDFLDSLPF